MREIGKALFNKKQCRQSAARPRSSRYVTTLSKPLPGNEIINRIYLAFENIESPVILYNKALFIKIIDM